MGTFANSYNTMVFAITMASVLFLINAFGLLSHKGKYYLFEII